MARGSWLEQDTMSTKVQDMGNTSLNNQNILQKSGQNVHTIQTGTAQKRWIREWGIPERKVF